MTPIYYESEIRLDYFQNNIQWLFLFVCSKLDQSELCYEEFIETCDEECQESFEAGFNFTRDLIEEDCENRNIPICESDIARECILHLWELVDVAEDFQTACE